MKKAILVVCLLVVSLATADAFACRQTSLSRSKSLIDAVLVDMLKTYKRTGGGGISGIKLLATDVYEVSVSQEKAVDKITYHLTTRPSCQVVILKKTHSTSSKGFKRSKQRVKPGAPR